MPWTCAKCGATSDICYTDAGVFGMVHGQGLCRDCYIADGHPECPNCKELGSDSWRFCAHCGSELRPITRT